MLVRIEIYIMKYLRKMNSPYMALRALTGIALLFCAAVPGEGEEGVEAAPLLLEAEDFQFTGGWMLEERGEASGGEALVFRGSVYGNHPELTEIPVANRPALSVFSVPESGVYSVYARVGRASDGEGSFRVRFNKSVFEADVGEGARNQLEWKQLGVVHLPEGELVVQLEDPEAGAICDALLLLPGKERAEIAPLDELNRYRLSPVEKPVRSPFDAYRYDFERARELDVAAVMENDRTRIEFREYDVPDGDNVIIPRFYVNGGDDWIAVSEEAEAQMLFLLYAENVEVRMPEAQPYWHPQVQNQYVEVGGDSYPVPADGTNPFASGRVTVFYPRELEIIEENKTVRLVYEDLEGTTIATEWRLNQYDVGVKASVTVERDGYYSIGYVAFDSLRKEEVTFVQLPPLYQHQRVPEASRMSVSSTTPHPLALVETTLGRTGGTGNRLSFGTVAEPGRLPFEWPTNTELQSPYGFSLVNADGKVQPVVFSPVLGLDDSYWETGESRTVEFRLFAKSGDWMDSLKSISEHIMNVRDYRHPIQASLTDAVLNMVELMKDGEASGWDDELKGFYNIEFKSGVTHAAPLAVVSAAILSGDEELYAKRALPTIAFTLSRPYAHFGRPHEAGNWAGQPFGVSHISPVRLIVPTRFYGSAYWQGLHDLLGRLNPWMEPFILPGGEVRHTTPYNDRAPYWSSLMAEYRHQPDDVLLEKIERRAEAFIEEEIFGRDEEVVPYTRFYDIHIYPYWWDLIDLYEITGNQLYLQAAEVGGYHTIAGLWSHPASPEGEVLIHPGNKFTRDTRVLWKDDLWYRLGASDDLRYEDASGRQWVSHFSVEERSVPAWQISRVGLGLETPSTYFLAPWVKKDQGLKNITMATTAPHLLRLARHTGNEVFKTYARNLIIGRFANYPGYYYSDYTDLHQYPDYPFTGPDLTRLYYHHIPPHLAFTMEYIFAQAEYRSNGAIAFPWVKQQDYAWFINRIYGTGEGEIYGEEGLTPLWDRDLVDIDNHFVDWFAAKNSESAWIVAMSQSDESIHISPVVNMEKLGVNTEEELLIFTGGGKEPRRVSIDELDSVRLDPKGIAAVRLARSGDKLEPSPLRTSGHVVRELGTEFGGELHVFRIRSPQFEDALYAFLTEGGGDDAFEVSLTLGDGSEKVRHRFPYEFMVYPVSRDKEVTVEIEVLQRDTGNTRNVEVVVEP